MNREAAQQEIRAGWRELLPSITSPAKQKVNGETSYICPLCGHGTHGDGLTWNPQSKDGNGLICFGCGFSGDIIDLYRKANDADYNTAINDLAGELNITIDKKPTTKRPTAAADFSEESPGEARTVEAEAPQDYTEYYKSCAQRLETDTAGKYYLTARGLTMATARKFNIGFDPAWQSPKALKEGKRPPKTPRLIMPITATHYEARDTRPEYQAKPEHGPDYRKMKEGTAATFNRKALQAQEAQEVFITEGVIDALSIIEAGGQAVSLSSANRAEAFINELITDAAEGKKTAATFIICLDNDIKGREAAQKLRDGLQRLDLFFISADISAPYKDPNEHLQKDRAGFIAAVQKARKAAGRLKLDTGAADIDEFFENVTTTRYKALPTGIKALDNRLAGGFINEWLVIISAPPGAGKTVLATQICENIARAGRKCLYFNFEMSKDQLIARSLARIIAGKDNIDAKDLLRLYEQSEERKQEIFNAGLIYKQHIAPNMLYNPDSCGPNLDRICEAMEARVRRAESQGEPAPVVCIDYLQMIEGNPREDIKETIKRAVYAFKKYAEEHHTVVIGISAQSRAANGDTEARQDAGRDTSNIEYSADLQMQILSDKDDPQRIKQLYITKCRFAAPSLRRYLEFEFLGAQGRFKYIGEGDAKKDSGKPGTGARAGRL